MEITEILELKLFDNTILTYLYFLVSVLIGYLILIPLIEPEAVVDDVSYFKTVASFFV